MAQDDGRTRDQLADAGYDAISRNLFRGTNSGQGAHGSNGPVLPSGDMVGVFQRGTENPLGTINRNDLPDSATVSGARRREILENATRLTDDVFTRNNLRMVRTERRTDVDLGEVRRDPREERGTRVRGNVESFAIINDSGRVLARISESTYTFNGRQFSVTMTRDHLDSVRLSARSRANENADWEFVSLVTLRRNQDRSATRTVDRLDIRGDRYTETRTISFRDLVFEASQEQHSMLTPQGNEVDIAGLGNFSPNVPKVAQTQGSAQQQSGSIQTG